MFCDKFNVKYVYEDTGLCFRFIFYRKNVHGHVQVKISKRDIDLLDILSNNPSLTIKDLSNKLEVSEKTIYRSLSKLKEINKIVRVGKDKNRDNFLKNE